MSHLWGIGRAGAPAIAVGLFLLLVACGGSQAGQLAPPSAPPGTPPTTSVRKEVTLVKSVRPILVNTLDALTRADVVGARTAFEAYDPAWNGIEVYVNVRSRSLYEELEQNYQAKLEQALAAPQPKAAEIRPLAEAMLAKYDEAIRLSEAGPPLSPLFDDVAAIRITRAPLRTAGSALQAGNVAGARRAYAAFQQAWPGVKELLRRSEDSYTELEGAVAVATSAFGQERPPAELTPPLNALVERYNYALSLVNAAARNADLAKAGYTADDLWQTVQLATMEAHLRASLPLWESGDYDAASAQARRAAGDRFDAVAAPLKAKGADAALKRALDGYAALASAAGEATKVRAANKTAVEAVWLAQQAIAGQFWSDVRLHGALMRSLLSSLREEYGAAIVPAGPQTAWGILAVAEREYRQRVDPALKASASPQTESIANQLQVLHAALPDAVHPPASLPAHDAVDTAASAIGAALDSSLGLLRA